MLRNITVLLPSHFFIFALQGLVLPSALDMVANMVAEMVADMEMDMVADMEVNMDMVAEMGLVNWAQTFSTQSF